MPFEISPHRKKKKTNIKAIGAVAFVTTAFFGQGYFMATQQESVQQPMASMVPIETLTPVSSLPVSRGEVDRPANTPKPVEAEKKYDKTKVINAISNNLGGVFIGQAEYIYTTSRQYNVNPMLVAAIARQETGNGTSVAVKQLNNPGGLMGNNGLMRFATLQDGVLKMVQVLKNLYIDQGLTSIEQIQKKYCPIGAENDPTKLNKHWLPNVTANYLKILEEAK